MVWLLILYIFLLSKNDEKKIALKITNKTDESFKKMCRTRCLVPFLWCVTNIHFCDVIVYNITRPDRKYILCIPIIFVNPDAKERSVSSLAMVYPRFRHLRIQTTFVFVASRSVHDSHQCNYQAVNKYLLYYLTLFLFRVSILLTVFSFIPANRSGLPDVASVQFIVSEWSEFRVRTSKKYGLQILVNWFSV